MVRHVLCVVAELGAFPTSGYIREMSNRHENTSHALALQLLEAHEGSNCNPGSWINSDCLLRLLYILDDVRAMERVINLQ
jgi:hypothetical protein